MTFEPRDTQGHIQVIDFRGDFYCPICDIDDFVRVECTICGQQIMELDDLDLLGHRCDVHRKGRHEPHTVEGRDGAMVSKSGMGGLILSKNVEWITL